MLELAQVLSDKEPKLVCITETWLNDSIPNSLFDKSGYQVAARKDRENKMGGGVLI